MNEDGTVNTAEHPAKRGVRYCSVRSGLRALTNDKPLRRLRRRAKSRPGERGGGMEILYAGEAPSCRVCSK